MKKTEFGETKAKLLPIDNIPPKLREHRERIREMMKSRCAQPDSPIPEGLSGRVADFILMLCAVRAQERVKAGRSPFPDVATVNDDIARSAETIELLFVVAREEANPPPPELTQSANEVIA